MATKWRRYSRSLAVKLLLFLLIIASFSYNVKLLTDFIETNNDPFALAFEENYYRGEDFITDSRSIAANLRAIVTRYQGEEHVLSGATLSANQIRNEEEELFYDFRDNSKSYNPNLSEEENMRIFREVYADKIAVARDELIARELSAYNSALRALDSAAGVSYYAAVGETEFSNVSGQDKEFFKTFPAYLLFDSRERTVFPADIQENKRYYSITSQVEQLGAKGVMYIAFSEGFLAPRLAEWQEGKDFLAQRIYPMEGLLLLALLAFFALAAVIGRSPAEDEERVHLNTIDRIYNDVKLAFCAALVVLWGASMAALVHNSAYVLVIPLCLAASALVLLLLLSLIKHLKNRTLIRHTALYAVLSKLFGFAKEIFNSGSLAVKIIIIAAGYPLLVALTFFMFPVTIGAAVWLSLKRAKEFQTIRAGVEKVKAGDLQHTIKVSGKGELSKLASSINSITDGLKNAVQKELKSERLKTELITNVSHDIRTPLTSIITYVDLLKNEKDEGKKNEYIAVLEQKSQRLKFLTDDLFEAAKAASGNVPVNIEEINLVSLLTQGLAEVEEKREESRLDFKVASHGEKVIIRADGKLFWRAVENLLSNIFKYAQAGSRVYIDIAEDDKNVTVIFKNISAYELNISAEELMERFKRGDESRASQGSGLGLSIAKSLIEAQGGSFWIEVDGDLFKASIKMPR